MDHNRICEILKPFLEGEPISENQVGLLSIHLALLLKWNEKMNLTSVRNSEQIVERHFGESIFAARKVRQFVALDSTLIDIGSGAGFPGIPIKIWTQSLRVALIESRQKKATFLREVVRNLGLPELQVENVRAETLGRKADVVTLRAVEDFKTTLPVAAALVKPRGKLTLLIGESQISAATSLLPQFYWNSPIQIPVSRARTLLVGELQDEGADN